MARPTVIRNEVILEAARAVFLERGILATSAEVAQRAGVSEGSVFKRFKTKSDLFRAAMGIELEELPDAILVLMTQVGKRTVEENLIEAGEHIVAFFEKTMPIMMMTWSNPKVNSIIPQHCQVPDPPPLRAQRRIAEYLSAEQAQGRLRSSDELGPRAMDVLARAYLGALSTYVFTDCLLAKSPDFADGAPAYQRIEPRAYVTSYVNMLLKGIAPMQAAISERTPTASVSTHPHAA